MQHRHTILSSLYFPEIHKRLDHLEEKFPRTYEWIWEPSDRDKPVWDSFVDWLDSEAHRYWISGKLGSGKSTLMKYLVQSFSSDETGREQSTQCHVAYKASIVLSFFFYEPGAESERTVSGCLRSLLWQLIKKHNPDIQGLNIEQHWPVSKLYTYLKHLLEGLRRSTLIFLDGLDECRPTDEVIGLVEFLEGLDCVKLCVSSRPEQAFVTEMDGVPQLRLQDLNQEDIDVVIQQELINNFKIKKLVKGDTAGIEQEITWQLRDKAQGVFLWVRLVVKSLIRGMRNKDSIETLLERIEQFPSDVYQLYTFMWQRLGSDSDLYAKEAALYCLLVDAGVMQFMNFCFAIDDKLRQCYLEFKTVVDIPVEEIARDLDYEHVSAQVNARSAGFLEVVHSNYVYKHYSSGSESYPQHLWAVKSLSIEFIHRSARQYLFDTMDGKRFLARAFTTDFRIHRIKFEAALICDLIFPALFAGRSLVQDASRIIETCIPYSHDGDYLPWLQELDDLCLLLHTNGFITTQNPWLYGAYLPFNNSNYPTSRYALVDLALVSARVERYDLLKCYVTRIRSGIDSEYASQLLFQLAKYSMPPGFKRYDISELQGTLNIMQTLIDYGADLNTAMCYLHGDEVFPLVAIAQSRWRLSGGESETYNFLVECGADPDKANLPTCWHCFNGFHRNTVRTPTRTIEVWGSLKASDYKDFFEPAKAVPRDSSSRPFVLAMWKGTEGGFPVLYGVQMTPPQDIENLTKFLQFQYFYSSIGGIEFEGPSADELGTASGEGELDLELFPEVEPGSRLLDSLADALRYIGKSEESIRLCYIDYRRYLEKERSDVDPCNARWNATDLANFDMWVWGSEGPPENTL